MANLKNYKVEIINPATSTVVLTVTPSSNRLTEPVLKSLAFTTNRIGGCGGANIALMCESASALNSATLTVGYHVRISLRCGTEAGDIVRYYGEIESADEGHGTDPKVRTFAAVGLYKSLKTFPLLLFLDAKTPAEAVTAIIQQTGGVKDHLYIANDVTQVVETSVPYTIAAVDFADTMADAALKMLAEVHAPGGTTLYGVDPGRRIYFRNKVGLSWLDPGFRVGVNLKSMSGAYDGGDLLNGALVTLQRKVGGGNLTLFVQPAVTRPWRIGKESVPELVDAAAAYEYGENFVSSRSAAQLNANFTVLDFGEQLWADEQINKDLVVYTTPSGGSFIKTTVDSYTVRVGGDGSVATTFQMGKLPQDKFYETFRDALRAVEVTKQRELWTAAELAANGNDTARSWRRSAGNIGMRNIWTAQMDTVDAFVSHQNHGGQVLPGPYFDVSPPVVPTGDAINEYPQLYDERYDADRGVLFGNPTGCVATPFIPTGLAATKASMFVDNMGHTLTAKNGPPDEWERDDEAGFLWKWDETRGLHPFPLVSSTYDNEYYSQHTFVSASPAGGLAQGNITIELGRPMQSRGTSTPANFADMAALTIYTDIVLAYDVTNSKYYAIRVYRKNTAISDVYVAVGWYESGALNQDHWQSTTGTFGSFDIGEDDASSAEGFAYLTIKVVMPAVDNETWSVTIYKENSDTVLFSKSGAVDIGGGEAWSPLGCAVGGMRFKNYVAVGAHTHGVRTLTMSGTASLSVAVTRDGAVWAYGFAGTELTLSGGTAWSDGSIGLVGLAGIWSQDSLRAWGIAFR